MLSLKKLFNGVLGLSNLPQIEYYVDKSFSHHGISWLTIELD